jgi:hypothetical protein
MEERIKLYYNSQIDTPWCALKKIRIQLKKLEEVGIPVTMIDTASMEEKQIFEHYMEATYPSVRKQYRISQIFGSQSKSGQFFGRQQPALLVYQGEDRHPVDVYPHDFNGKRVLIEDFLEQKIRELKLEGEAPSINYEILDTFTCSVEQISGEKAYLRLRNQGEDEDRDLCLEYPLEQLKRDIGEVSEGMFLRCDIREFDDEDLTFHFEKSTSKVLSLEERQALLEEYKGLLEEESHESLYE